MFRLGRAAACPSHLPSRLRNFHPQLSESPIIPSLKLPRLHTLDAWLAYRDFRLLWLANFCGFTGQWLQLLSIGWLVKDLSVGSGIGGLLVLSVSAINTLPGLLVNPITGVLGDRLDRRKLAITMQAASGVLALGFAFLVAADQVRAWHAYAYVLISGSFLAITQPMQQVLISNTVPRESLVNAYAINTLTVTGTRVFGPFVGGILIFTLGYFWNFALEAALYLGVVLCCCLPMRTPYTGTESSEGQRRFTPFGDIKDGPAPPVAEPAGGAGDRGAVGSSKHDLTSGLVPAAAVHGGGAAGPGKHGRLPAGSYRLGRVDLHADHRHLGDSLPARLRPVRRMRRCRR